LSYATWYWPAHVEQLSGSPQRAAIKPALLSFFTEEEHFEDWLDYLDTLTIEEGPSWSNSLHRKLAASFASPPSALFVVSCFGLEEALEFSELTLVMDVNQSNRHRTSALYLSARWGHIAITRRLLELGAAVDAPGSQYGSALQAASFAGYEEIVQILLEKGASFSPAEPSLAGKAEYSSPLQAALANGHGRVAKLFIDQGCTLTTQKQFDDAIETASFRGNIDIVEGLLGGKAGVFTPEIRPDPLQVALSGGKERQAARLIQEYGNDGINEEKGFFGNALAAAIASCKLGLVQLIVDAGANLDACGRFGTPLRAAVVSNHFDIVRYLLEKGVNPNIEDKRLGDPLQAAASLGNVDMMLLLLEHGASVNGSGGHFGNTLQAASFNGHEKAVRLLIERGARLGHEYFSNPGRYRDAVQAAVYAGH
jgi:ankyrin repeat protein